MRRFNHSSRFIEMFGNAEKTKPLSEYIGTTFPGEWGEDDLDGSGVNVIRTTNFTNSGKLDFTNVVIRKIDQAKIDKKHLVPGDIILERSGGTADNPVGRVVYFEADGTFLFNNFTQLLRCKDGVNSLFVFYSLFNYYYTHKNEIRSMGNKTTGIQNLKMDKYWDIPIADASPEQQEQFVCLYKQSDKSKFSNFKSRFFSQFADLPFDHKWKDVLTIINGKAYGEEYKVSGTYPICGSGGIMGYGEKKMCDRDSIILGRKGNIDKPIYMSEDYWIVDTAFCLSPNTELIHPVYLYYWCKQFDFQKLNKQAVLPSLTRSDLEQIDIQVPEMAEQLAFVEIVHQADKSKFLN